MLFSSRFNGKSRNRDTKTKLEIFAIKMGHNDESMGILDITPYQYTNTNRIEF
jgi:hypothetical protein